MALNAGLDLDTQALVFRFHERVSDLFEPLPLQPLVDELLGLLVSITHARLALVIVPSSDGSPGLVTTHPRDEVATVERSISSRILTTVMTEGRTVCTPRAVTDDRFADVRSVQQLEIQAVLCVPVRVQGVLGAVYMQGLNDLGAFYRDLVERFAKKLGRRLAHSFYPAPGVALDEATRSFRRWFALEVLERHRWRATDAVESLRISRSTLYDLIPDLSARKRARSD